jgi:hypothetical protein
MQLFAIIFTTLVLAPTTLISSCRGQEPEQNFDHLTELLDTMLKRQRVEMETGVRVGQEASFLNNAGKKNIDLLLLIANSRDENDTPLPL